jgi:hypothetical protein
MVAVGFVVDTGVTGRFAAGCVGFAAVVVVAVVVAEDGAVGVVEGSGDAIADATVAETAGESSVVMLGIGTGVGTGAAVDDTGRSVPSDAAERVVFVT